jgi:hypothetical protein
LIIALVLIATLFAWALTTIILPTCLGGVLLIANTASLALLLVFAISVFDCHNHGFKNIASNTMPTIAE